jgi:hypothetical protein
MPEKTSPMLLRRALSLTCFFVTGFVVSNLTARPERVSVVDTLARSPLPDRVTVSRPGESGRYELMHFRPIRQGTIKQLGYRTPGAWWIIITQNDSVWYLEAEHVISHVGPMIDP